MSRLKPEKLHVQFLEGATPVGPIIPRRYTLTHSDRTGELFLTIGPNYDVKKLSHVVARFMRDEVLAKWVQDGNLYSIHLYCHVSGGIVFGTSRYRNKTFRKELPLALEAFRYGDDMLVSIHPELNIAPVFVHFQSTLAKYNKIETWGNFGTYAIRH